ncbi:MAG: hypothetical protein AAGC67_02095 [Myxococcota bacterium]
MDDTLDPTAESTPAPRIESDGPSGPTPARVLELVRPFDPVGAEAEDQYDAVVRRVNRVRARRTRLTREFERLELPFVEGEPKVLSGPRRGEPLSAPGRKRRLARLVEVGADLRAAQEEERFAVAELDRMNRALDRWARETYGL